MFGYLLIVILIYLAIINITAIILTVYDKRAAKRSWRRVSEKTLMITAAIGGAVAMLITMLLIRHKTKHKKFTIGIPVIIALQIAAKILLFPVTYHMDDGGSSIYRAKLYRIENHHSMWEEEGVWGHMVGTEIVIFGITVREAELQFVPAGECECRRCRRFTRQRQRGAEENE